MFILYSSILSFEIFALLYDDDDDADDDDDDADDVIIILQLLWVKKVNRK